MEALFTLVGLISMFHVLEHLPDPVGYLSALRQKFLEPDGWLLIEVPNLYAHDCFEVAHLNGLKITAHTMELSVIKPHVYGQCRRIRLYEGLPGKYGG